mmetsp:Transcript_114450/g.180217  ORF Transcript_114450/g.180217 Transcript_114450/m.180217 type:complete len:305 (+) Transcript_114450:56-970(+)
MEASIEAPTVVSMDEEITCRVVVRSIAGEVVAVLDDVKRDTTFATLRCVLASYVPLLPSQMQLCSDQSIVLQSTSVLHEVCDCEALKGHTHANLTLVAQPLYIVLADPISSIKNVLCQRASARQWFYERGLGLGMGDTSGTVGSICDTLTNYVPPNGYQGARTPWTLDDVAEWLMLLPRPCSSMGDLLATFRLNDDRYVFVRALSDYYSGCWDGVAVRIYIALSLEDLESFAMGFAIADIAVADVSEESDKIDCGVSDDDNLLRQHRSWHLMHETIRRGVLPDRHFRRMGGRWNEKERRYLRRA